ncbi:MAG: 2'-deoxycytidine 5'-triphosphate deaminase, partial [Alphaproteobacteria bacterium]|nr:2'-deoxycytidine 5'-triphosphate deaminase [Alphaproteobacteria bacterium]
MADAVNRMDAPEASAVLRNTGILPYQAILEMRDNGEIKPAEILTAIADDQIQPASIDLRLGYCAYPVDTSFLPGAELTVMEKIRELDARADDFKIDLRGGAVLEKGRVYVIPLLEEIYLKSEVAGFANPKSSTGRLDILTRLIADKGIAFDQVEKGYKGKLYVEVVPRTFSVVVKTGTRLNQLRFTRARGNTPDSIPPQEWKRLLDEGELVDLEDKEKKLSEEKGMLRFTVDLRGSGEEGGLIGYRAKRHARRIDLEQRGYYDPLDF